MDEKLQLSEIKAVLKTFFSDTKIMKDDQLKERITKLQNDIAKIGGSDSVPGENTQNMYATFAAARKRRKETPRIR